MILSRADIVKWDRGIAFRFPISGGGFTQQGTTHWHDFLIPLSMLCFGPIHCFLFRFPFSQPGVEKTAISVPAGLVSGGWTSGPSETLGVTEFCSSNETCWQNVFMLPHSWIDATLNMLQAKEGGCYWLSETHRFAFHKNSLAGTTLIKTIPSVMFSKHRVQWSRFWKMARGW